MELTARKKQILKIVVDSYVATAEPVGSKVIAQQMPGKISSATIRNDLADLVEMGYLEQPHTSAGRIPTPSGYRMYVNELMERCGKYANFVPSSGCDIPAHSRWENIEAFFKALA